jgi:hypothetical protein
MSDPPPPTPEGDLIRRARQWAIPKLTIRAAAARIGMSPEQWGNVERGYRPSRTSADRQFSAPAATVAKMAKAVGVTPEQLEAEGKRPDAAAILREIVHRHVSDTDHAVATETWTVEKSAEGRVPLLRPEREDRARPYADRIWEDLLRWKAEYAAAHPGVAYDDIPEPPGSELFPGSRFDILAWDENADVLTVTERLWLIAELRARHVELGRTLGNRNDGLT